MYPFLPNSCSSGWELMSFFLAYVLPYHPKIMSKVAIFRHLSGFVCLFPFHFNCFLPMQPFCLRLYLPWGLHSLRTCKVMAAYSTVRSGSRTQRRGMGQRKRPTPTFVFSLRVSLISCCIYSCWSGFLFGKCHFQNGNQRRWLSSCIFW